MVPAMLSALACIWQGFQGNNQGRMLDGCPPPMPSSLLSSHNAYCSGHRSPIPPEAAGRSGGSRQGGRQRQGAGELQVDGVGAARGRAAARRDWAACGRGADGQWPCGAGGCPCPRQWANPAAQDPFGPGPESARPESGPGLLAPAAQGPPQQLWTTWSPGDSDGPSESKRGCCCGSGGARAAGHGPMMPPIGHMLGWGRSQAVWAREQARLHQGAVKRESGN